jgi:hypothetical protein
MRDNWSRIFPITEDMSANFMVTGLLLLAAAVVREDGRAQGGSSAPSLDVNFVGFAESWHRARSARSTIMF